MAGAESMAISLPTLLTPEFPAARCLPEADISGDPISRQRSQDLVNR